jgi:hypothetical protein
MATRQLRSKVSRFSETLNKMGLPMISTLKSIWKIARLLIPIMLVLSGAADCAEKINDRILATRENHKDVNQRVNSIKDRFVDNRDGTVTDSTTNLMWVKNGWRLDSLSATTWFDAVKKCRNLKYGYYSDWRLPTIEEWRSILDTNNQFPALVEPNPFVNIITHLPYWSSTEFIYSKNYTCRQICPLDTYTVILYSGSINHQKKTENAFILPVRTIK